MDDWIALNVLRNVALSTNSVAASVEPAMQQRAQQQQPHQFLALSPGGSSFAASSHSAIHPHHSQMMAHTPTTASIIAAMGDPFGPSSGLGLGAGMGPFAFDPMSFSTAGAGAFDFGGPSQMSLDVQHTGSALVETSPNGGDSVMSSPNHRGGEIVKVEGV
jgi:regulatory factor X